MVPKHRNRLQFDFGFWWLGRTSPHLLYANTDFSAPDRTKRVRRLLAWLELCGPDWLERKTLRFLKEHQDDFRRCVKWLSNGPRADFSNVFDPEDEESDRLAREKWDEEPALQFLQLHGLQHGGVALEPTSKENCVFEGLELQQKKPRDPLDPICWHMLSLLGHHGTVFIRSCGYWKCGKFFWPLTPRRLFCSDSCRALNHVAEREPKKFRKRRSKYMRKYRSLPPVKRRKT
jgi:hypothetical protein